MKRLQNSEVFQSGKVHLGDPSDVIPVQVSVRKRGEKGRKISSPVHHNDYNHRIILVHALNSS